ncbi:MAG: methyltransferase domain-containing protein [Anaerolineae bacterium]|nr:methyltransferase domain-containing protein [Anaerolineae bacterium]
MLDLERQERLRARYRRETPGWRPATEVYDALLRQHLHPDSLILDAGCGQAGIVARARGRARAVGLDVSFEGYRDAVDLPDLVCGDLAALPFAAGSFTVVASSWVFEHLAEPQRVFAEFARVLRPGGVLVFLTPNARSYAILGSRLAPGRLQKALVWRLYRRPEVFTFRTYYRANTPRQLGRLLSRAGFACEALHLVGDPTYVAFNEPLYRLGVLYERLTDSPRLRGLKVHIVGAYRRLADDA